MKLAVSPLGQRDPRWANILLGFNTDPKYTIGLYGCLITCLAAYVGKQPNEVNDLLKAGGGFTAGSGLFVWSKCTILGLNQTYVSPRYESLVTPQGIQNLKDNLDKKLPCLAEIDFNPATPTEDMHFVLITGYDDTNFYILDPWTGDNTTIDKYGGIARALLQFRVYDKTLPLDVPITPAPDPIDNDKQNALNFVQLNMKSGSNYEGTVRGWKGDSDQLNGFIAKWIDQLKLPIGSGMVEIEADLANYLPTLDAVQKFRDAIEGVVGPLNTDSALLAALAAFNDDKKSTSDMLAKCQVDLANAKNNKVVKQFTLGNYLIKVFNKK